MESQVIDGRIYCRLRRVPFSIVEGLEFDLLNEKHHLLLAGGASVGINNALIIHQRAGVTGERVWLR